MAGSHFLRGLAEETSQVTSHGRKYGEKKSYPFPMWNGIFEHVGRIGCAIWVFLWCLDKVTQDREGVGIVLGGSPVKISRIAADLGMGEHTVRRHCDLLEKGKCIRRRRTPYGFVIEVFNSHKFGIWHASERAPKRTISRSNLADLTDKNGRNKEDAAVDAAIDAATNGQPSVWSEIKVSPRTLPPQFREICEQLHHSRNGQPIVEFLSACMDLWESRGHKIPAPFAKAAVEMRNREKERKVVASEMPELEELPWRKK